MMDSIETNVRSASICIDWRTWLFDWDDTGKLMFEELATRTGQVTADDFEARQDSLMVLRRIDGDELSDSISVKLIEVTRGRMLLDRESFSLLFETESTGVESNQLCVLVVDDDPWITIGLGPIVYPHGEPGKTYLEAVFT